ncbi:hypothetical protein [Candidatus Chromulinivorax destructor]|uniref:Uncharacterized protein n=1 Tax=Candidatus Chromulinivorax destructor TaxID=2066483 RepID=A0A345ZCL8_9BACT|nr:hypothetical protein [Candidatus Chromulinivorax destructor]AXK61035.1 hypothetical protein C0J27_04870 [Candidatus Chromulinivorax destructor]
MKIKQTAQLRFNIIFNRFFPAKRTINKPISFIYLFFLDATGAIYGAGVENYIEELKTIYREGMNFQMIELSLDYENQLAYINEPFDNSKKEITPEIDALIESQATVELCRRDFMGYAVMTQDNLFHLLRAWNKILHKNSLFALIYLDDKDWYDVLPFDTQEAMEKFVADHTQQEIAENK